MTDSFEARKQELEDRILAAKTRTAQLLARKAKLEARKNARDKAQQHRIETRQKILLGSFLFRALGGPKYDWKALRLNGLRLDAYLTKPEDRAAFGLDPLPEASAKPSDPLSAPHPKDPTPRASERSLFR